MYHIDKVTKPFHSCNAHTEHYKDMEMFVSYTTPIRRGFDPAVLGRMFNN